MYTCYINFNIRSSEKISFWMLKLVMYVNEYTTYKIDENLSKTGEAFFQKFVLISTTILVFNRYLYLDLKYSFTQFLFFFIQNRLLIQRIHTVFNKKKTQKRSTCIKFLFYV